MANSPDQPDTPRRPHPNPPPHSAAKTRVDSLMPGEGKGGGIKRDPAKHSKKDPAKPTRAKANRPDSPPTDPALAELLNPGIRQGTAGIGSQTRDAPPPPPPPTPGGARGAARGPRAAAPPPRTARARVRPQ